MNINSMTVTNPTVFLKKSLLTLLLLTAAALTLPTAALAQMAEGEVRRIDAANNKVTIRHGEIKNLDMPPMSMVFVAKPASVLKGVQVGDKIRFSAIEENSQYVVTKIEKIAE
jgi:Cu/Ag efflux protein CusF